MRYQRAEARGGVRVRYRRRKQRGCEPTSVADRVPGPLVVPELSIPVSRVHPSGVRISPRATQRVLPATGAAGPGVLLHKAIVHDARPDLSGG